MPVRRGGSTWIDLWAWLGGGEVLGGTRPARLGLGLFGVFQSMLLSRRHPNLVAVVDADVAAAGYVYLVMKFVEGCTLADIRETRPPAWSLPVLVQVLRGLDALHAEGIVHRNLKPANVLLSGDVDHAPRVKFADFGISRGLADDDGTPSHPNSPSRARGSAPPSTSSPSACWPTGH